MFSYLMDLLFSIYFCYLIIYKAIKIGNVYDDILYFEEAVILPDNDENIIITSPPACSSLTKTTNNLVADNISNNLVTDYVDEEREGIEFISDVNIVDGEPMEIYSDQD